MKPRGTVVLQAYVPRAARDLAQAKATGHGFSKWVERAVRDLAAAERADAGRLFAKVNTKETT